MDKSINANDIFSFRMLKQIKTEHRKDSQMANANLTPNPNIGLTPEAAKSILLEKAKSLSYSEILHNIAVYCGFTIKVRKQDRDANQNETDDSAFDIVDQAFQMKIWKRENLFRFFVFRGVNHMKNQERILGPWLKAKLASAKIKFSDPQKSKRTDLDENSVEGQVVVFDPVQNPKEWTQEKLDQVKAQYKSLCTFFNNKNLAGYFNEHKNEIANWNQNNPEEVKKYISDKIGHKKEQSDNEGEAGGDTSDGASSPHPYRNLIYFGAPGTGKSYQLKVDVEGEKDKDGKPVRGKEGHFDKDHFERVTFYPTYSYAQFVGCYKPTMESDKAPILSPKQLVNKLKIALSSWPQWLKIAIGASRPPSLAILLFGEKFYDSLEPLEDEDQKRILKGAGRGNGYDQAYLKAGIDATKVRRRTSGASGEIIVYKFVPGPFLRILVKALKKPQEQFCLVIEEINRANAAAVFGDVFQLLDRGGKWSDGDDESIKPFFKDDAASEYDVAVSEDIKRYLKEKLDDNDAAIAFLKVKKDGKGDWEECRLRIPSNMYIWATMNSADQGVSPMDTAFKRRWEFEYIDINNGEGNCGKGQCAPNEWTIAGKKHIYYWNKVRRYINDLLSENGVNEDKLMGARFITATNAAKEGEPLSVVSSETFKSKVLMYLWEDAARMCRQKTFADGIKTFSKLQGQWDENGCGIFKLYKKDGKDAEIPSNLMNSKHDEGDKEEEENLAPKD